jgi:site-specific recombinase XerC
VCEERRRLGVFATHIQEALALGERDLDRRRGSLPVRRAKGGRRREAGVRRWFAPHHLRLAHAVEFAREGASLNIIQRQLGHANLGTTSIYLRGIDT